MVNVMRIFLLSTLLLIMVSALLIIIKSQFQIFGLVLFNLSGVLAIIILRTWQNQLDLKH